MTESALEVDEALLLLRDAGLVILPQGESRSRFHIRRPRSVEGNRRLEYSRNLIGFVNNEPVVVETLDAPMSMLERSESSEMWNFSVWEWCPGPGPGDFERSYPALRQAVSDILGYYFGDPGWMCTEWETYRLKSRSSGHGPISM